MAVVSLCKFHPGKFAPPGYRRQSSDGASPFWKRLLDTDEPLSKEHRAHLTILLRPEFYRFFNLYPEYLDTNEQEVLKKLVLGQNWGEADERFVGALVHRGLVIYDDKKNIYRPFSSLFADYLSELTANSSEQPRLELTGIEASLHQYLRRHPNQTCTVDQLLQEVWTYANNESSEKDQQRRRMQVAISRLRTKLKDVNTGEDILSIRDVGYRYIP
jgi:DNA-binding winged helix-turn-helix (wHTH) protein